MTTLLRGDAKKKRGTILSAASTAVAWRLRQWLGLYIYGIYTRLLGGPAARPADNLDCTFRVFEQGDLEEFLDFAQSDARLDLDETFVRSAFAKGDACAAVFSDGRLVSYDWMAFTPTHDARGVHVQFGPRYRYSYKAFTLPDFRGRHATRAFKPLSDDYCVQRGRDSTIAFIAVDNRSSIRLAVGLGNRRIGLAGYLKLGPVFIPFRTSGARAEGFRFFLPDQDSGKGLR